MNFEPSLDRREESRFPRLWGKLKKDESGQVADWLPLLDHCTDVAVVFQALCVQRSVARSLQRAAGRPINSIDIGRLSVLAFLHDIGKCNHGFQAKALASPARTAGHVRELSAIFNDEELFSCFLGAVSYATLSTWFDDGDAEDAMRMLLASASHHGKPIELDDTSVHLQKPRIMRIRALM